MIICIYIYIHTYYMIGLKFDLIILASFPQLPHGLHRHARRQRSKCRDSNFCRGGSLARESRPAILSVGESAGSGWELPSIG